MIGYEDISDDVIRVTGNPKFWIIYVDDLWYSKYTYTDGYCAYPLILPLKKKKKQNHTYLKSLSSLCFRLYLILKKNYLLLEGRFIWLHGGQLFLKSVVFVVLHVDLLLEFSKAILVVPHLQFQDWTFVPFLKKTYFLVNFETTLNNEFSLYFSVTFDKYSINGGIDSFHRPRRIYGNIIHVIFWLFTLCILKIIIN